MAVLSLVNFQKAFEDVRFTLCPWHLAQLPKNIFYIVLVKISENQLLYVLQIRNEETIIFVALIEVAYVVMMIAHKNIKKTGAKSGNYTAIQTRICMRTVKDDSCLQKWAAFKCPEWGSMSPILFF